jgi:hypothetical protein
MCASQAKSLQPVEKRSIRRYSGAAGEISPEKCHIDQYLINPAQATVRKAISGPRTSYPHRGAQRMWAERHDQNISLWRKILLKPQDRLIKN